MKYEDRFRAWLRHRTSERGERNALSLHLRRQRNFISKYLIGEPKTLPLDDAVEIVRRYHVSLDGVLGSAPPTPDPEFAKLVTALADVNDPQTWEAVRVFVERFLPRPDAGPALHGSPRAGKSRTKRGSR